MMLRSKISLVASFAILFASSMLGASIPSLDSASGFGVLGGSVVATSGTLTVNGDLGAGGTYTPSGTVNVSGTNFGAAAPASAITDFNNALSTAQGFTPTVAAPVVAGNVSFTIPSSPAANTVFSLAAASYNGTFTFNATSDPTAQFIIEVPGSLTLSGLPVFILNGVSANNILWVVNGSFTDSGNGTFDGTVFASNDITVSGNATYNGGLFAADVFTHSGNNTVNAGGPATTATPEPATSGLVGFALLAGGFLLRKFRVS